MPSRSRATAARLRPPPAAESVECALKFAMLSTGRRRFIGVLGAFHGKSLGALAATSKAAFRGPFATAGVLLPFAHVKLNDAAALRAAFEAAAFVGEPVAGLLVEPVVGEGGIHVADDAYLRAARALCDEFGARLIFDEVQSGMGRCGDGLWACERSGAVPDLVAVGKGLGGGVMPVGACVGTPACFAALVDNPFLHTSTFGGNPLACAAAIAALAVVDGERLADNAAARGAWLRARLAELRDEHPAILKDVRGRGLMIGLEFHDDGLGYAFSKGAFARRLLLAGTLVAARVIRVEPPLTITHDALVDVVARLRAVLGDMAAAGMGDASPQTPPAAAVKPQPQPHAPMPTLAEAAEGDGDDGEEDEDVAPPRDRGCSVVAPLGAEDESDCSSVSSSSDSSAEPSPRRGRPGQI